MVGQVDFSSLFVDLSGDAHPTLAAAKAAGVPTINYGVFLNTVSDFLIVAFAIFLLIRQINRMTRESEAAPIAPSIKACPHCLSSIHLEATRCAYCTSVI